MKSKSSARGTVSDKRRGAVGRAVGKMFETLEVRCLFAAAISTDAADYLFGSTANITGSGFESGEVIQMQVLHATGTAGSNDDAQNQPWQVQADANGNVVTAWDVTDPDAVNATYELTAVGMASGLSAMTSFTDAGATPDTSQTSVSPTPTNVRPTITANVKETGSGSANITNAEYFIDVIGANGTGTAMTASDGSFNSKNEDVTATLTTVQFNALTQGSHTIYVHGKDANGTWGATDSATFVKDTIAPSVSAPSLAAGSDSGTVGDNITNDNTPSFNGTAETGAAIRLLEGATVRGTTTAAGGTWSITSAALSDGLHTLVAEATDAAGNVTTSASITVRIDTTAPTIGAQRDTAANANGWNNNDVASSYSASDAGGLASPATGSFTFTAEGNNQSHTFTVTDLAGNSASATVSGVKIDKTAPTINAVRNTAANANGWNNTNVATSYTASDGMSGLSSAATGSFTFTTEGASQSHTFTVIDLAGNSSSATISSVNIDKTAPTINAQRDTAANANGWNNTNVASSYSAGDGLSGLTSPATGSFKFTAEGTNQSHTFTVTDLAGNSASATVNGVKIDKTAPTINSQRNTAANANGWNNTDVASSYTSSDALSGLPAPTSGSFTFTAEGANQSHTFTVTDLAGNSASSTVSGVNIDKTAPTINAQRDTAANANGWNNTNVATSYSAGDALSGLASSASGSFTFTAEGSAQSHSFTVTDLAGNSASASVSGVNIDKTAPTISAQRDTAANGNGWNNTDVSASYSAGDGLSGLLDAATGSFTFVNEGSNQSHTFTVTDLAGNSASSTVSGVNIDKTAPTIIAQRDTAANAYGWNNTDVSASYSAGDGLSGLLDAATASFTFVNEGSNQSNTFTVTDLAGNSASSTVSGVNIDKTAPTIIAQRDTAANAYGWNNTDVSASYNASDILSGLMDSSTGSFTFTTEGSGQSHTFMVMDLAGNTASDSVNNINIDKTAPTISAQRDTAANGYGWNNSDVLASYSASDSLSGLIDPATGGFTFTSEGAAQSHTFMVTDLAGNSGSSTVSDVNIDKTAPTISAQRDTAANVYGWNNSDVLASYSASDALSGLSDPASGSFTFTAEGSAQFHTFSVMDLAGNSASATVSDVNIDKTAPTISAQRDTAANGNGWNNSDVSASYSASDDLAGLVDPISGSFTFTSEGSAQSHTFIVTDLAGNSASATVSGVNIDKTAPSISAQRDTAANVYGWNNSDVASSYSASDGLSGLIDPATGSFTFTNEGSAQSHTFMVTDLAGNSASATVSDVNIDKTAPTISAQRDTAANVYGWNNSDVAASYSASDGLSGLIDPATGSFMFTNEGAGQSHTFTVTDLAGNMASDSIINVNIDKTAPTINAQRDTAANVYGWNNSDVAASYSASDGLSGLIDPASGSFTFTSEGSAQLHTIMVTDLAGNSASATVSDVNIDKTAPTISAQRDTAANVYGWNNSDVAASYSASDGLSGLIDPATGGFTFMSEGSAQSHTFMVTDLAGNSASSTVSGVNIDKTAPTIYAQRDTAANVYGWNNSDVAASYSASDGLSGLIDPASGSFTFSNEGAGQSHTFTVTDLAGNMASDSVIDVNIDKTAPTISAGRDTAANGNGWNNSDVSASYSASDALSGLIDPANGSFTFMAEGANQSHTFMVTDLAGNSSSASINGVNIDKTAPTISAQRDTAANLFGWNNSDIAASYSASDGLSGLIDPASGSFTFTAEGSAQSHTFMVTDLAGNIASATVSDVNIDKTAPTINAQRDTAANVYGWNNSNVGASYSASDGLSGLVDPASGSFTFMSEGSAQSHTFTVTDLAGNSASSTVSGVNIDKTAPTINAQRDTAANAYGWNKTDVSASYTASDALSGLLNPSSGLFTFTAEGSGQSHTFMVMDLAGNTASDSVSNVNIDKTAPTISAQRDTAANGNGWNNSNVSSSYTASDGLSGLLSPGTGSFIFTSEGAGQSHQFAVCDLAGNTAAASVTGINIDKTAPTISAQRDTAANANGWNNTNVASSYTASDGMSGLASPAYGSFTFIAEGVNQSHMFMVTDLAGNSSSASINGVNIDKTAPTITSQRDTAANANGWNNSNVSSSYSAGDGLSGLASLATGSFTFMSEGAAQSHSFTVMDLAGNSASATVNGVNIDKTAPTIFAQRDTAANANGWNNTNVSTSYSAGDALSGLASPATGSFIFTAEGSNQSHTFMVADLAGNSASATISNVNIDKTAPNLVLPANMVVGPDNALGAQVAFNTNSSDGLSGIATLGSNPGSGNNFAPGTTSISVITTDKAGNSRSGSFTITVNKTGLNQSGDFGVMGTSGDDVIIATANLTGPATFKINGVTTGPFAIAPGKHVVVFGLDGNDTITGVGNMNFEFHGDNGNDCLTGDNGDDVLFGEAGDDMLVGAAGNDVLLGGGGSDRMVGSAGDDILIAGEMFGDHNGQAWNFNTLRLISAQWVAAGTNGADADLASASDDVIDSSFDQLTGGSGRNWYIVSAADKITDLSKNSLANGDLVTAV